MSKVQREHYRDRTTVDSDPFGLVDRDNRNHTKKQDIILDHVRAEEGDKVLEVGCGHGLHAERYSHLFDLDAIDLSESLVEETRSRVSTGATVKRMDAMRLPMPDDYYDAVVGTAVLHHLEDQQAAIEEWARVTRPGGSVTLMEPNPLFPKDLLTAYVVEAERHKRGMFPWRLRAMLDALENVTARVEPRIYTPPWPSALHGVFDTVDDVGRRLPGARWGSQMLLINIHVTR